MSLSRTNFEYIRGLLLRQTAIVLDANKGYLVQARLLPIAKRRGLDTIDQLVAQLQQQQNGRLVEEVVDAMTTNETSFFRDVTPFDELREVVLPELFRRRSTNRRLAIWCAACSTGQEPYSITMLLREHFSSYLDWDIDILGSDISGNALAQARQGCYSDLEVERGLPRNYRDKYFRREGSQWAIAEKCRSMVDFRNINLVGNWPSLPKLDVVLLRNVMVYFEQTTKKQVLSRVRRQMNSDGYLFLGGAETTMNLDDGFARVQCGGFSYYRLRQTRPGTNGSTT